MGHWKRPVRRITYCSTSSTVREPNADGFPSGLGIRDGKGSIKGSHKLDLEPREERFKKSSSWSGIGMDSGRKMTQGL